jgi:hypothetical protein
LFQCLSLSYVHALQLNERAVWAGWVGVVLNSDIDLLMLYLAGEQPGLMIRDVDHEFALLRPYW